MQPLGPGILIAERYRLERKLGAGGMGSVWLATDLSLDSTCAIKLVDPDKVGNEEVRVRFQREARAAAQIRSANVVDVFDHGLWQDMPFIVMAVTFPTARELVQTGEVVSRQTIS